MWRHRGFTAARAAFVQLAAPSGAAVHIAACVAAAAGPGEVLVSRIVVDLVAGSGLSFVARGEHVLKGVAGEWGLFAVEG